MSILDNQSNLLDNNFENHNFLPQKIDLSDLDLGIVEFIENLNLTVKVSGNQTHQVRVIYLPQELWAERKLNWKSKGAEAGEEILRPVMTLKRTSVIRGTSPFKYTIPNKKKFKFIKVPIFDGTLKGFDIYKVPQPTWVDLTYDLKFFSRYQIHSNQFYETVLSKGFSDGQGYFNVNGYFISAKIGDPSYNVEDSDISSERLFEVSFPITVHGKILDPTDFEKVSTITKISIKITEKE